MEQEHTVQHAFRATAALFRALGISQDTASRELGLRGHTSFSFWKQGRQEFDSRYAVALYKLVVEGVNAHWPTGIDEQIDVTKKLVAVFHAWENACEGWREDVQTALRTLREAGQRLEHFGDARSLEYAQELQRLAEETGQLSESLRHISEFEAAWQRGREEILIAMQRAEGKRKAAGTPEPDAARRERGAKKASAKG